MTKLRNGDRIVGGVYVVGTQMDPTFEPPSASLNPAATVSPAGSAPAEGSGASRPGTALVAARVAVTRSGGTAAGSAPHDGPAAIHTEGAA